MGVMMRFRLSVADATTGEEGTREFEASSEREALLQAKAAGFFVTNVDPLPDPPAHSGFEGRGPSPPSLATSGQDANPQPAMPAGKVKHVTEVKAICAACGNVWYYTVGERVKEFGRKMQRGGEELRTLGVGRAYMPAGATRTTECPKCGSKAINRETVTHEIVTQRKPGFLEKARKKQLEAERYLSPNQLAAKRKRDRIVGICVIGALSCICLIGNLLSNKKGNLPSAVPPTTERPAKRHSPEAARTGDEVPLRTPSGDDVPVTATKADFDRLVTLAVAKDTDGIRKMLTERRSWSVPNGTRCRVIQIGFTTYEIRFLEGSHQGESGWVASDFVKK
jgi:hypothetical protein